MVLAVVDTGDNLEDQKDFEHRHYFRQLPTSQKLYAALQKAQRLHFDFFSFRLYWRRFNNFCYGSN